MKNRKALEQITDKITRGFAYPSISDYSDISETALTSAGIVYARLAGDFLDFELPKNWLRWKPTCHHKTANEVYDNFSSMAKPLRRSSIMYVWGHTYEFDRENNWEIIEKLLERCHSNPDIWFATNIEIYNYATAFNSLVFSSKGDRVHNPTAVDLWGVYDANNHPNSKNIIKILAGGTVK